VDRVGQGTAGCWRLALLPCEGIGMLREHTQPGKEIGGIRRICPVADPAVTSLGSQGQGGIARDEHCDGRIQALLEKPRGATKPSRVH